ncbi:MAG: IPT/TIG domain-containing protein [Elusimicrobia bacterium]|nr:IPT/TIG domain-containing protein [Elusimicrobiota bacterium]
MRFLATVAFLCVVSIDAFAASTGAFADSFSYADGLITNQNAASPRSPNWLVVNGSLFASGGKGWTGVPDTTAPNATSSNGTGSAIFSALTQRTDFNADLSLLLNVIRFPLGSASTDGAHVYVRYQDANNFYQVSVRRRDGRTAIKKKRGGVWTTFTTPLNGPSLGVEHAVRVTATNQTDGSVGIQLFVDGALLASAVDASSPLTSAGRVAMAGQNTEFKFDDFTVAGASAPSNAVPPDLFAWAKAGTYLHDVQIDATAQPGRKLLRFSTAVANKGRGAFELRATVASDGTTNARQRVYDDQGGYQEYPAGTFVFSSHAGHNHFHYADFANYRLRAVTGSNGLGSVLAASDKVGFAMFDNAVYDLSLPGAPRSSVYQRQEQSSLDPEGISVGWADVYDRSLGDQWIDVTGLPNGAYWLEIEIDPFHRLIESDETNNFTWVKVFINSTSASTNSEQPAQGGCLASSGGWVNSAFAAQSGTFEARFDATPGAAGMDGVIGLGTVSGLPGLAGNVRFSTSGYIDVRFGDHYWADTPVRYSAGVTYHFRMAMNTTIHTYGVFVSSTGPESTLANNFQFRLEQMNAGFLDHLGALAATGSETVCNLAISTGTVYPAPVVTSISPSSAAAGGPDFVLNVFGGNFLTGRSTVRWNGAVRETGYISATQIQALITAADLAAAGAASVTVFNPGPGGGTSNAATFTIVSTAPAGATAFQESFPYPDGLITNAYAAANPTDPASVKSSTWLVTNGSLFASGGMGWTGVPDNTAPNANSSNGNGSAVFRVVTQRSDFRDYAVSMRLLNAGFTSTSGTPAAAVDGVQFVLRYQSASTFYLVMIHRRDNTAVIKRKLNGTYTTLASVPLSATIGAAVTAAADVRTREDGAVVIQLSLNGSPRLTATDAASPILPAGRVGLWATNDQFKFDDFVVTVPTVAAPGSSVAGARIPGPIAVEPPAGPGPNPWRADRHQGVPMIFRGLASGATVKLFTTSGRSVTSLREAGGAASWDLSAIRSGFYLYVITAPGRAIERGTVAIIR